MSSSERTLFLIKPDGVQRGLVANILERIERKGLKIVGLKMMQVSEELAKKHYEEHVGKPFYPSLKDYVCSGPIIVMVLEGENVIAAIRQLVGATDPIDAQPGTIRADLAMNKGQNLIHASDSNESAKREISLFFPDNG